jgi:hypothetical protein
MLDMNLNDNTRHSVAEALVALFAYCTANNGCICRFCRLDVADKVLDHSTFSVNRHARFRNSGARHPGSHLL